LRNLISLAALIAASFGATAASATDMNYRYANAGTANAATYTFTAAADGDLTVYRMNSTGFYMSTLGVKVNGTTIAQGILDTDHWNIFSPNVLGTVHAGDSIEFFIDTYDRDDAGTHLGTYYSTVSDNADGLQHIFADEHPAEPWIGTPLGTFIGFEDTTTGDNRGDLNYNDYTIVVPNLLVNAPIVNHPGSGDDQSSVSPAPEPASWAMMLGGFGLVGGAMRRRRTSLTFA
jgi:hypothetical protein